MKLGEALSLRARQAQKLNDLRGRIIANAVTQEGEGPAENVGELIAEYEEVSKQHRDLLFRIALTNHRTQVEGLSQHLSYLLQDREDMRRRRAMYDAAANAATPGARREFRYMRSELRMVPQVSVAELREKVDAFDNDIRNLDAVIQEVNWQVDLEG